MPTVASHYWSATTHAFNLDYTVILSFINGDMNLTLKGVAVYVRAVRSGS